MSLHYIVFAYGVPARVGRRVRYNGDPGKGPQLGTIVSAQGAHLGIRLDGQVDAFPYHPTWMLQYLDDAGQVIHG